MTGSFILTAGTYRKEHLFAGKERLDLLQSEIFELAHETGLDLDAWAVFSNHYHLIGRGAEGPFDVSFFARRLHGRTSVALNRLDKRAGRKVWQNFRETALTYENSYFARLHYVHTNPVKHGLVPVAREYLHCSAHWFETRSDDAFVKSVYGFKIDQVNVEDEFDMERGALAPLSQVALATCLDESLIEARR